MKNATYIVTTSAHLACEAARAWEKVCFYEHIETQPSLLLRTVLPIPHRTSGAYRKVGDISRCMYSDGGYLTKIMTRIVPGRIDFDIIEQSIRYSRNIALKGGTIVVEANDDGGCSVHMLTRYELRSRWFRLLRPGIDRVVSAMHKIVFTDMQIRLSNSVTAPAVATSAMEIA